MDPKDGFDIISITGMAGIGKTTFARKTYEHEKVVSKFKFCFWIDVTENFNRVETLHYILKKITSEAIFPHCEDYLIISVNKRLENTGFLLVIDDVGRIEDWDKMKEVLPKDKGKVFLITRDNEVAAGANIYRKPHHLGGLGQEASSSLLKLQVFDKVEDCDRELEEVMNVVAERCGGVPLVILVIRGIQKRICAKTRSVIAIKKEWSKISTTVNEILEEEDHQKMISDSLEKSYKKLSQDERICFLYSGCSLKIMTSQFLC